MTRALRTLGELLLSVETQPDKAWLFLPLTGNWTLETSAVVLELEEVPPELEDKPDAGIPAFARQNMLKCILPVLALQDIVSNAREQKSRATAADLLMAFNHYYERDAFIEFER